MSSNGDVSPSSVPSAEWVRLNVGGTVFTTTKSTLQKAPKTFLVSDDFLRHEIIVNSSWQAPLKLHVYWSEPKEPTQLGSVSVPKIYFQPAFINGICI